MVEMSDDEYDEELPAISVNSSRDLTELVMPPAHELAAQRAREASVERQLRALNDELPLSPAAPCSDNHPAPPARSDSSGSEGEAALVAAASALHLQTKAQCGTGGVAAASEARRGVFDRARLAAELARTIIASATASPAAARFVSLLKRDDARALHNLTEYVCRGASGAQCTGREEVVWCCAWLCVGAEGGGRARRALHHLLDVCATQEQVCEVSRLVASVCVAGGECAARALLSGADRARSGAGAGADRLHDMLLRHSLATLLKQPQLADIAAPLSAEDVCELAEGRAWRSLCPRDVRTALQICGRALVAAPKDPAARSRALAALAAPSTLARGTRHSPDHLRVAVSAAQLQLVLRAPPADTARPANS